MTRRRPAGRWWSRAALALLTVLPWVAIQTAWAPTATATGSGLHIDFYNYTPSTYDPIAGTSPEDPPARDISGMSPCDTATVSSFDFSTPDIDAGGNMLPSGACSLSNLLVHATGYLTVPGTYDSTSINVAFRNQSKDGVYLTLTDPTAGGGAHTAISNWSATNPIVTGTSDFNNSDGAIPMKKGISYDVDLWYYHFAGTTMQFKWYWLDPSSATPQYTIVPASALTLPSDGRPRADQLPITVHSTPVAIPLGSDPTATATLTATGGSGEGGITYAYSASSAPGPCTVSGGGLVTPSGPGACYVTVTKADDGVFAARTSDPLRVNVLYTQSPRLNFPASLRPNPSASPTMSALPVAYGDTVTLSTDAATGQGLGAVTYTLNSGDCTLNGDQLTVIDVVTECVVTATKAADGTFDYSTTAAQAAIYTGSTDLHVQGVAAAQTALVVGSSSYKFNYVPGLVPATATLTHTGGGSGNGALSYVVADPTVCRVDPVDAATATVVALQSGNCDVTVTKAADSRGWYQPESLALPRIVVDLIAQTTAVTFTAAPPLITYNPGSLASTSVTVSGGDSTGALNLTTTSAGVCVVSGPPTTTATSATWMVTAGGPGVCMLTASRAGDLNYVERIEAPVALVIADQVRTAATPAGASGLAYTYGQAISAVTPVTATGGVGTTYSGAVITGATTRTLDASGTVLGLSLDSATGQLTGTLTGTVSAATLRITATDINSSTSYTDVSLTISPAVPTLAWLSKPAAALYYGVAPASLVASASGATGNGVAAPTGAITYSALSGSETVCAVDAGTGAVTVLRAGTCLYGAAIAADANYTIAGLVDSLTIAPSPPTPPSAVRVTVLNRKIVVAWGTPADDGGTEIVSYTARATAAGVTSACSVGGTTHTCTIIGLDEGATYDVSATATNSDVGLLNGASSVSSVPVRVTLPVASVNFATGTIAPRYDPNPPTSALDDITSGDQDDLLNAGVVVAPADAPTVTVTANLADATYDTPIDISIPQTIDSGSEVRIRVIPPRDTPVGSILAATMVLPGSVNVSLGSSSLTASSISGGVTLATFAIVTPGNYTVTVRIADPAAAAVFAMQSRAALGTVHQTIDYAIKVVAGSAGVPKIAPAPVAETPTPTPEPTVEPTPTPEPTEEPTPTQEPTPEPSASIDDRGLVVVDPLDAPVEVAKTAVAAVALVSAVSAAASAAAAVGSAAASAGGAAASSGGSAGGSGGGGARSGGSAGGSTGGSAGGSASPEGSDDGSENVASIQTVDVEGEGYEDLTENWGDALGIWGWPVVRVLDRRTHDLTVRLAPVSPLLSKLLNDGAYTRALIGLFSAILPLAGVVLAVAAVRANGALLLPPPTPILVALAVIGVADAAAGALAMAVFAVGMGMTAGLHTAADVRMMMGLMIIGFGPALLAGAFRGIRRNAASQAEHWWERVVDLGVAPFIGGWATKGMVDALSGLAGVQLPVAAWSSQIGLAVAGALAVRVVLEEFTAQYFPNRLNAIHPTEVPAPHIAQKAIALAIRAAIFFFVAEAFIGSGWYLWVGTFLFILPNYVGLFSDRFPNSPRLYHLLPAGLPGMAFTLLIASVGLAELTHLIGETPELAKIAFAVLPIPSAAFQILAMFGREPREGDVRWYLRDSFKWLYWIGGPMMLVYTMHLAGIL